VRYVRSVHISWAASHAILGRPWCSCFQLLHLPPQLEVLQRPTYSILTVPHSASQQCSFVQHASCGSRLNKYLKVRSSGPLAHLSAHGAALLDHRCILTSAQQLISAGLVMQSYNSTWILKTAYLFLHLLSFLIKRSCVVFTFLESCLHVLSICLSKRQLSLKLVYTILT